MKEPSLLAKSSAAVRDSVTFKVLTIGILVLILLIPASMVRSLIREREERQASVISEIGSKWGAAQTVSGPIVSVPYKEPLAAKDGKKEYVIRYLHILPDTLAVTAQVQPEIRYRGIYEAVLYNTKLNLCGQFFWPDLKELGIPEKDILWSRAFVAVGISDMRGVRENIEAKLGESTVSINSGIETADVLDCGISAKVPVEKKRDKISFSIGINLNGSERIAFVPVGKLSTVEMTSSWASPSFDGAFLPVERDISKEGFKAKWNILHLNRNYPQYWTGSQHKIENSSFGVKLFIPADTYQKSTRTVKYAIMFIGFTFLAFFISEVMTKIKIHPIQYLLVGLALIVFYTLLISISEHLNFGRAYLISSVATIGLITGYARSVIGRGPLTAMVGGILAVLYGYLYILLQLEDYSLLLGSIGLFVVLGAIMYMTRRINWYLMESVKNPSPPPLP